MTPNCPCSVQYSAKCGVHRLPRWKGGSNVRLKYDDIAFSPKLFQVLATNTAGHRGEVVFRSDFVFKLVYLHKSVFPVVSLDVR